MKTNDQIFSEISENGFITYKQIGLLSCRHGNNINLKEKTIMNKIYKQAIEQAISEKFAKAVFL